MHKYLLNSTFTSILLLSLTTCFQPGPTTHPGLQVIETTSQSVSKEEIVHINNCGGKGETEQVTERSFSLAIEGAVNLGLDSGVIEASVSSQYSQYRNITKSIKLVAPPGTNMEFVLKWTEQQWLGVISANGQSGTYTVNSPIQVEQVSSRDISDCLTSTPINIFTPTDSPDLFAVATPIQQTLNCQNVLKNVQSYLPGQNISGPSVLHPFEGCAELAIQLGLVCIGRWGINIESGQTITIPQNVTLTNGNTIATVGNFSTYENDLQIDEAQSFWLTNCP